ncbi:MAG: 16S rRNA (uracil(1498)-N(3))-methyltransferase [Lachnospiraceae bacterium]|nr:16S rRNA (uracil(1498)-N(3))-methyltransferase [Lachnospiraceae bacterium]
MYQFFVEPSQINTELKKVFITGPDVNHIKNVLRMKPGEELNVSNGADGKEYRCAILEMTEDMVNLELRFIRDDGNELPVNVTLYQGLPKADKMELIIQKCVELGVNRIVPVSMKRCVVKLDEKKSASKISRWQAIAESAAKQSKRGIIPEIAPVKSFADAIKEAADCDVKFLPYEMADSDAMDKTRLALGGIKQGQSISVFIGPEGGFDEDEIEKARAAGMEIITLGKRILRTETAGMTVMSWIMLYTDGKEQ